MNRPVLFDKVGAPQADNDSSNPSESFHRNDFSAKISDLNII